MAKIVFALALAIAGGQLAATESEVVRPTMLVDDHGLNLPDDPNSPAVGWKTLSPGGANSKWQAVGELLRGGKPGCTTTVIQLPNCGDPSKQKVQVLTNGHCVGSNAKSPFAVKFGMFKDTPDSQRKEIGGRALYSTQNSADVGLLELDVNYQDLIRNFGIQPIEIGRSLSLGEKLKNVAIPMNGLADKDKFLRISENCRPDKNVTLIDAFRFFLNELAISKCSAVGGSSGSGLFNSAGQLVGLMNAGTLNTDPAPPKHNCEVDSCVYDGTGVPKREKTNFGFDVTYLHKCYKNCKLDTNLAGCPLPAQDSLITNGPAFGNPNWTKSLKSPIPFATTSFTDLRIKGCSDAKTCRCDDESGYKPLVNAGRASGSSFTAVVNPSDYFPGRKSYEAVAGQEAVFQFLCVNGKRPDGTWDKLKNATLFPLYLYAASESGKIPIGTKRNGGS